MRKITAKKYAAGLYEALKDVEKGKMPKMINTFVVLLAKNKCLSKSDKIIEAFKQYTNEQEGIREVNIFSAQKFESRQKEEMLKSLHQALKKKIELKEYVDRSLLGGMVVKYGDKVIDGSIKKRIALLAHNLK